MLLMPIIDDLLKQEAFKEIVLDAKGGTRDSTTFMQSLTPQKNVEKAIHFIKSKFGVGIVALDITGHSIFMSDNINLARTYNNPANDFKAAPTNLMFEGLENNYSLSAMYDAKNRIISEVQSQTMNSQVDAGKDPYAVMLGINNQTLGIMMYLVRRGVPVITTLKFLSQPMIEQYLIAQRKNESIINKQRGDEINKKDLITEVYIQNGLSRPTLNRTKSFNESQLEEGIKRGKIDAEQAQMFEYFLTLVDDVSAFNDLKNGITVDTKGKKDKSAVESFEALWEKIEKTKIISDEDLNRLKNESVIAPFFEAQALYRKLYFPFYALESSAFGPKLKQFKDQLSNRQKGIFKKEKSRSTVDNDFLLFLIQNFNKDFNIQSFDKLFGFIQNEPSLAEQIKVLSEKSTNPVIKALFPLLSIAKDELQDKNIDVLRLFERELSTIDLNDFIDSMKDIRDEISEDLYKSIIQLGLYQAGFNNSPFSLNKIFPTFKSTVRDSKGNLLEFQNDYLRELQTSVLKQLPTIESDSDNLFTVFEDLFYRNNTDFLPKRYSKYSPIRYFYTRNKQTQKRVLFYKENNESSQVYISPVGGTHLKRYFMSLASGLNVSQDVAEPVPLEMEIKENYKWARYAENNYEVSSAGDPRFSALNAKLSDGRTIEEAYQLDVKGYRSKGNNWQLGKSKAPLIKMSKEESWNQYKQLWIQWASENPTLINELAEKAKGKTLTDKFASTEVSQARALSEILNSKITVSTNDIQLSLFDDVTFTSDELQEAKDKKEQCIGGTTKIIK